MLYLGGFLVYLTFFSFCLFLEKKRTRKWNAVLHPKMRWGTDVTITLYCAALIYTVFFTIISVILADNIFYFRIMMIAFIMLIFFSLVSKISLVITNEKITRTHLIGKTVIAIDAVEFVSNGFFIIIKGENKVIWICTKGYESGLQEIRKRLLQICYSHGLNAKS